MSAPSLTTRLGALRRRLSPSPSPSSAFLAPCQWLLLCPHSQPHGSPTQALYITERGEVIKNQTEQRDGVPKYDRSVSFIPPAPGKRERAPPITTTIHTTTTTT